MLFTQKSILRKLWYVFMNACNLNTIGMDKKSLTKLSSGGKKRWFHSPCEHLGWREQANSISGEALFPLNDKQSTVQVRNLGFLQAALLYQSCLKKNRALWTTTPVYAHVVLKSICWQNVRDSTQRPNMNEGDSLAPKIYVSSVWKKGQMAKIDVKADCDVKGCTSK